MIPFIGYAPDLDPTTPGVITNCAAIVPTLKGFKSAPTAQNVSLGALAAACQGAAICRKLDDTTRFFAGTGTAIYEAVSGSWTDRTRASGGAYSAGADVRWRFSQFGNVSLAVQKADVLQASTTGAFANLTAPKASIVETVGQFVFLFDTDDATYSDSPDRWWCCAKGDHTDWVPDIDTECTTGRLTSSPGRITAGKRFGDGVVAYKSRSMFFGSYTGSPAVWDFKELPGEIGTPNQEAVVVVGTPDNPRHIFMGFEDFYSFDGARAVPIGTNAVKETVFGELNKQYAFGCWALHDRINSLIYFYYPAGSSVNPNKCVVYNYRSNKWGRDDRQIEAAVEYISGGVTYSDLGASYSTYNDLPVISYDSPFWTSGFPIPAIFNTSHRPQTLDGVAGTSSITSGDTGDDTKLSLLSRVRMRFITVPSSGTMTNFYKRSSGDSLTQDQTVNLGTSRFNVMRSSGWHRFSWSFQGAMEVTAYKPELQEDGDE